MLFKAIHFTIPYHTCVVSLSCVSSCAALGVSAWGKHDGRLDTGTQTLLESGKKHQKTAIILKADSDFSCM